jgi:predicted DNA-binding antitoxin AbrB/MazE fold protein
MRVMPRQLDAVYEGGVPRPLEPLILAEHQRVRLTLDERPARLSWESSQQINERREELRWLARNRVPMRASGWPLMARALGCARYKTGSRERGCDGCRYRRTILRKGLQRERCAFWRVVGLSR